MNKEDLINFENWVVEIFNDGQLRSPVHLDGSLDGSQEDYLIKIFEQIKPNDWVFSTYRGHYHALLKGVDPEWLKNWIKGNKSIHVMNKEHKFFTSAIVGGTLSIALGTALSIKMRHALSNDSEIIPNQYLAGTKEADSDPIVGTIVKKPKVYVFLGDMTANTGAFREVFRYAVNHKLPIKFIVANNFLSTDTDCADVWGLDKAEYEKQFELLKLYYPNYFDYYNYERKWPHYGSGKFVAKLWENMDKEDVKAKGF